jgi:hypothetical protein
MWCGSMEWLVWPVCSTTPFIDGHWDKNAVQWTFDWYIICAKNVTKAECDVAKQYEYSCLWTSSHDIDYHRDEDAHP